MGNACALTAAVEKVWTAPLVLEKAQPLVLQDVTPQGRRWHDTFHAPLSFLYIIDLLHLTVSANQNEFSQPERIRTHLF